MSRNYFKRGAPNFHARNSFRRVAKSEQIWSRIIINDDFKGVRGRAPLEIFENSIVIYVFFINFLTNYFTKFIASHSEFNTTILWGFYKCPLPPTGGTDLRRCLDTTLPTTPQKTCRKYKSLSATS